MYNLFSIFTAVRFGRVPKREKARILAAMQQSSNSRTLEKAITAELEDEQRLLSTVVRAHIDTCDFTRDKVEPMLQRAREQPSYTACPPTLVSIKSYFSMRSGGNFYKNETNISVERRLTSKEALLKDRRKEMGRNEQLTPNKNTHCQTSRPCC